LTGSRRNSAEMGTPMGTPGGARPGWFTGVNEAG
jgi:hypothetical protein